MKTVLQIEKKGYNDAYNFTEYFLHNALQHFGFNLTRDEKTADFSVTAYIDRNVDYVLFTSSFFDQLQGEEQKKFCEAAAIAMKSEALMYPLTGEIQLPNAEVYRFLYSSTSNAYKEPALIENGDSDLDIESRYCTIGNSGDLGFSVVNYGGPTQGLDVTLLVPLWALPFLSVESAQIRRHTKQGVETKKMVFERIGYRFVCRLNDYQILQGRNRMSALWCRTRSKYQCATFFIDLKLKYRGPIPIKLYVMVKPFSGSGSSTMFEIRKDSK